MLVQGESTASLGCYMISCCNFLSCPPHLCSHTGFAFLHESHTTETLFPLRELDFPQGWVCCLYVSYRHSGVRRKPLYPYFCVNSWIPLSWFTFFLVLSLCPGGNWLELHLWGAAGSLWWCQLLLPLTLSCPLATMFTLLLLKAGLKTGKIIAFVGPYYFSQPSFKHIAYHKANN